MGFSDSRGNVQEATHDIEMHVVLTLVSKVITTK